MGSIDVTHDEGIRRRLQVLYARQTREKQVYMEELKEYRRRKDKQMLQSIIVAVGPRWYQALSEPQRTALDTLAVAMYQDLLEGRPKRASAIMHKLGLVPRPSNSELMTCMHFGRDDPKKMLAHLYLSTYGYPIEGKRTSYCLNARLILSAILYLGLDNLIQLLQKTFAPEPSIKEPPPKPVRKPRRKLPSPYLTQMVASLYIPRKIRRPPPLPMPDLTELNEPYVEEPVIPRPPPPPPPPPPPKKRLPRSYCDKLAGVITLDPHFSDTNVSAKKAQRTPNRKSKGSKTSLPEVTTHKKKTYGLNLGQQRKKILKRRKPVPPTTGLSNAQYTINGVYQIHGKSIFVLGSIVILPAQGELIHGGFSSVKGECITIHCGFRGWPPPPKPDPCDCVKKWHDAVFEYVKENKCNCGHYFDYGNEGEFPQDALPYFTKPTRNAPYNFNYDTIFDLDPKRLHIEKEFKQIWETDSMLRTDEGTNKSPDGKKKKKKKTTKPESERGATKGAEADAAQEDTNKVSSEKSMKTKASTKQETEKDSKRQAEAGDDDGATKAKKDKKVKRDSRKSADKTVSEISSKLKKRTNPKPQDYLKCALRTMRQTNVAARLPDLHLVPELKEWMRRRLHGRLTVEEKKEYLRKSTTYWRMFTSLGEKGFGHVGPPKEAKYTGHTTWLHKQSLNDTFRLYTHRYRLSMFRSHAYVTNLLWRSMYQAEFPDKKFREIYFSYLFGRLEDIQLIHPYTSKEAVERKLIIAKKRYICLPAGYEPRT
uniref:DUF4771 domain-containing protein n=1 Tax=Heliothis virescens TaxID=7102 RepID=A0A2A4K774_HELVI